MTEEQTRKRKRDLKIISPIVLFLIVLCGCSLKSEITKINTQYDYAPIEKYETFFFLEQDTLADTLSIELGELRVKDTGFTINCTYEGAKSLAIKLAKEMGGNCFVITEHKKPSGFGSSCHQIKGKVLKLKHPELYEKEIKWHPQRKLKAHDFKGSIKNRPFQASTYSHQRYLMVNLNRLRGSYDVIVETIFNCDLSYFKPSYKPEVVLEHEQLHFDIAEIFSRKLRKLIAKKNWTYEDFMMNHDAEFKKIFKQLTEFQDLYDSEVYADPSKQPLWVNKIKKQLEELENFENEKITIQYK